MSAITELLDGAISSAGTYAGSNVRVAVKTNLGPEFSVYDPTSAPGVGSHFLDLLGIRAAVVVRDLNGNQLATLGTPPATSPVAALIALALLGLAGYTLIRGAQHL